MIVCTSICSNYLPKAMVLAKSLKETNKDVKMLVCLVEKEIPDFAKEFEYFDYIVLAKDLGFENFEGFIFKHSIVEASTSVKGQIFRYMLKTFSDENKFAYLDPDIKVYSELKELNELLDNEPIVITPHLTIQEENIDAVMDNELCALQHGCYNLGFLAIKRSEEAVTFINWWNSRLGMFCYDDIPKGIFTDQRWIDLAPCFFNTYILKHPGYNIAPWNVSKRKLIHDSNQVYKVNNQALRFFHFSGFDSGANEAMINKYVPNKKDDIYILRDLYVNELKKMGQDVHGNIKWAYDYYESGEKIDRLARIVYRDNIMLRNEYKNPFNQSNELFLNYVSSNGDTSDKSMGSRLREVENELNQIKNSRSWIFVNNIKQKHPKILKSIKKLIK